MIKEVCEQIDISIKQQDRNNKELFMLVVDVIANEKGLPKKFVELCYAVHEAETDTGETDAVAAELGLHKPQWFLDFLEEIKENNIEFWE